MIKKTRLWVDRFSPPTTKPNVPDNKVVWTTSFPTELKLSQKERTLNSKATIAYKRPSTLGQRLMQYRKIAHDSVDSSSTTGSSHPCGHCSLCGCFGKTKSMVFATDTIKTPNNKSILLKTSLTCKDWGIYVATCLTCKHQYVGQTSTSFSSRWNGHRSTWNKGILDCSDKAALRVHYNKCHQLTDDLALSGAYVVTFVAKPDNKSMLDLFESQWIQKLKATININRTILPRVL